MPREEWAKSKEKKELDAKQGKKQEQTGKTGEDLAMFDRAESEQPASDEIEAEETCY